MSDEQRYSHTVVAGDSDTAVKHGLTIKAKCGQVFVPKYTGKKARRFPDCPDCHQPASIRGQHRTTFTERASLPHYVYRCFDAKGRLLYVGCTYNPVARPKQHRAEKRVWVDMVARTTWTVWPDRRKALDMERLAIETENPIHNKAFKRESA